jgi:hypothetical protein
VSPSGGPPHAKDPGIPPSSRRARTGPRVGCSRSGRPIREVD